MHDISINITTSKVPKINNTSINFSIVIEYFFTFIFSHESWEVQHNNKNKNQMNNLLKT